VWASPDSDELHLIIADGMGGAEDGESIAEATVQAISKTLACLTPAGDEPDFSQVIAAVGDISHEILARHHAQGGTTLVACRAWADRLWFASVGDSALFLRRDERLFELNRRHEYRLDLWRRVLNGDLTLAQAQADPQIEALASYIGCEDLAIDATVTPLALEPGDTLLACSDGISDTLSQRELRALLGLEPKLGADALARRVEAAGLPHQDNYTAIVARYFGPASAVGGRSASDQSAPDSLTPDAPAPEASDPDVPFPLASSPQTPSAPAASESFTPATYNQRARDSSSQESHPKDSTDRTTP
jgi:protein phosphatase